MKGKSVITIFIVIVLSLSFQTVLSKEIKFKKIDSKKFGFTTAEITALAFDNNNVLWICARNQIFEYNGKRWIEHKEIFNHIDHLKNPKTGPCEMIVGGSFYARDIKVANNNHIWISTDFGLVEYDHKKWKLYSREFDATNFLNNEVKKEKRLERVVCFDIDNNNTVWAIFGSTIYILIDGKYEKYYSIFNKNAKKIIPRKFQFHCMDVKYKKKPFNDEYLIMGTSWGVLKFNIKNKTLRNLTPAFIEQPYPVYSINTYDNETFWLISNNEIVKMKESKYNDDWTIATISKILAFEKNLKFKHITKIFITPDNEKLLVVKNHNVGELYKYDDDSTELIFSLKTINSRSKINDIEISNDNKIWLATDCGLFKSY
ncbi:MAG: hypothetical protein KAT68_13475 [Bacteroidales bacterium]|nr:hypothetical protein [Bacteroidales bacterium]